MAPRVTQVASGQMLNFYESSFRQLSDIQQRQAGLLLGAAIADAAARPLVGVSDDALRASPAPFAFGRNLARHASPVAMTPASTTNAATAVSQAPLAPLLRSHSFSYALFADTVRVMASAGGDFDVAHVQPRWVATASTAPVEVFASHHGRLLHTLVAVLPFPVIYPYTSDAALRAFCEPFVECLTRTGEAAGQSRTSGASHVRDLVFSALGVVLRYLQSNPDATRNAAFMAVPGTALAFPDDVRVFCPSDGASAAADAAPPPSWLTEDVQTLCESLTIARASKSFVDGVNAALVLGGPHGCQRATLVGAMLGARLGVRRLPMDWLSATADHRAMATLAIEVAQQTWNPAHH